MVRIYKELLRKVSVIVFSSFTIYVFGNGIKFEKDKVSSINIYE